MEKEIIKIKNLNYKIFNNFNISFEKNKFTTISGSNKCGKTLILKTLSKKILTEEIVTIKEKEINEYTTSELNNIIGLISIDYIIFKEKTVFNEIKSINNKTNEIIKKYNLTNIKNKLIKDLSTKEKIYLYLIINILKEKEILLIDNIDNYYSKDEMEKILKVLEEYKHTIIMTITNLNFALKSDYLYIINNGQILLQGSPNNVLEKDNIINKIGLDLPFMYDLSIKLKDYNLIDNIELDMEKLVNLLWK